MTEIDIGSPAINRGAADSNAYTWIDQANSANATGKITAIEIWAVTNLTGCNVGTFYLISGTTYQSRDYEIIGNVTAGSKVTISGLDIDVNGGDLLGHYQTTGGVEFEGSGGTGSLYVAGDKFGTSSAYTSAAGQIFSVYGTGASVSLANIIKILGVPVLA